jgi:uncharacterized protein YecT (DUF1311 family)
VLLAAHPAAAQSESAPDPCAHVYGQTDLTTCWAREAERSENEMNRVYLALLQELPERAADGLKDAQELWERFREAHVRTLYGVESPTARWGREYPMCLSISRTILNRERTRQLRRILEQGEETICPL